MKFDITKEWFLENLRDDEPGCIGLSEEQCYDLWFSEVIHMAIFLGWSKEAISTIDKTAWREYFDDGHTAESAWEEEYNSAK